mmetsp:Transcript_67247/g.193362  ORF Transcript_67247/g.193362 Transcript_67247/m.193362 type:complete len:213 (+) Transcript_67247:627-1265(+)
MTLRSSERMSLTLETRSSASSTHRAYRFTSMCKALRSRAPASPRSLMQPRKKFCRGISPNPSSSRSVNRSRKSLGLISITLRRFLTVCCRSASSSSSNDSLPLWSLSASVKISTMEFITTVSILFLSASCLSLLILALVKMLWTTAPKIVLSADNQVMTRKRAMRMPMAISYSITGRTVSLVWSRVTTWKRVKQDAGTVPQYSFLRQSDLRA